MGIEFECGQGLRLLVFLQQIVAQLLYEPLEKSVFGYLPVSVFDALVPADGLVQPVFGYLIP